MTSTVLTSLSTNLAIFSLVDIRTRQSGRSAVSTCAALHLVDGLVDKTVDTAKQQKSAIFPYISTFLPSLKGEKNNRENGKGSGKFAGSQKLVVSRLLTVRGLA